MIKLLSLEGFLSLSSDAVEKIKSKLEEAGLQSAEKFDDTDDFTNAVISGIDAGDTVVLAAENEEYNSVKKQLIDTFSLRKGKSSEVEDAIFEARNGITSVHDSAGHCLMPLDADIYVSHDGLYSGFCVEFSNSARMILLPLDTSRLDDLLPSVCSELLSAAAETVSDEEDEKAEGENDTDGGIFTAMYEEEKARKGGDPEYNDAAAVDDTEEETENVKETVQSESKNEQPSEEFAEAFSGEPDEDDEDDVMLRLRSGEELVIDDTADEADLTGFDEAISAAAKTAFTLINLDKSVAFVGSETSPFLLAMCKEVDGLSDTFKVCDVPAEENAEEQLQVTLAKQTRLAVKETGADFGAAISPVTKGEKDGKEVYYSYIIIHDGTSAKAKKVSTGTQQGIESLIPHAYSVMFGLIGRKAESIAQLESDEYVEDEKDRKKKTALLVVSVVCAIAAIASAVIMVWKYFQTTPEIITSTLPAETSSTSELPSSSTSQPVTDISIPSGLLPDIVTTDPQFPYPAEPTASDVSNIPTSTPFASTKGTFTFTVYGYGHGVGMSQTGANYYASIGKSYLEILAMYYYGATLVLGDTTPETVKFGNSSFTLRDYLATAVESEMGGSYNPEALKAQAVAVYTFAKYYNFDVPATLHAFSKTPTQASYDAVDVVLGQYMVYNGEVARPYFHATSAGKTTSYSNAFGDSQIPYLAGGRPSYGDVNAKDYCTTVTYTSDELNALIYSKTGKQLSGDPANWFKILSHDSCINENTGYVSKIQVGEEIYSGYDFRMKVLGGALRSHCFTFIYTPTA